MMINLKRMWSSFFYWQKVRQQECPPLIFNFASLFLWDPHLCYEMWGLVFTPFPFFRVHQQQARGSNIQRDTKGAAGREEKEPSWDPLLFCPHREARLLFWRGWNVSQDFGLRRVALIILGHSVLHCISTLLIGILVAWKSHINPMKSVCSTSPKEKKFSMQCGSKPQRIDSSYLGRDFIVFILHTLPHSSCCLVFLIWHVGQRTKPRSKTGRQAAGQRLYVSLRLVRPNPRKALSGFWVTDSIPVLFSKRKCYFYRSCVAAHLARNILTLYDTVFLLLF